jgi:hypothetical protein
LTVYLDTAISGSGQQHFGGAQIQYVLIHLDNVGPDVFVADLANPDQLLKAGWFALGSEDAYGTSAVHVFWAERKWINFVDFLWHPEPTVHPFDGPDLCVWASDIRWALSPGTTGLMLVVGI